MKLEKRVPSGREKDQASIRLLEKLREQLYSSNVSLIRQSAFNLSWMQEDGLDILKEALFGDVPRRTKGAAAYGLRKMRGRMRKMAEQVLSEGLSHPGSTTADACKNAFLVLRKTATSRKQRPKVKSRQPKFEIRGIPGKTTQKRQTDSVKRQRGDFSKRR